MIKHLLLGFPVATIALVGCGPKTENQAKRDELKAQIDAAASPDGRQTRGHGRPR